MGLLALTLVTACAFEQGQGDEAVVGAPGTHAINGGGAEGPATGQSNNLPTVGTGTPSHVLPAAAADPCDPDPQPWKPQCPQGPTGQGVQRAPLHLTPQQ
jgi:hypothetical protein